MTYSILTCALEPYLIVFTLQQQDTELTLTEQYLRYALYINMKLLEASCEVQAAGRM